MSRSASAQATETDLEGEKVRSNPATGVRNPTPLARSSASIRAVCSEHSVSVALSGMSPTRSATRLERGR